MRYFANNIFSIYSVSIMNKSDTQYGCRPIVLSQLSQTVLEPLMEYNLLKKWILRQAVIVIYLTVLWFFFYNEQNAV